MALTRQRKKVSSVLHIVPHSLESTTIAQPPKPNLRVSGPHLHVSVGSGPLPANLLRAATPATTSCFFRAFTLVWSCMKWPFPSFLLLLLLLLLLLPPFVNDFLDDSVCRGYFALRASCGLCTVQEHFFVVVALLAGTPVASSTYSSPQVTSGSSTVLPSTLLYMVMLHFDRVLV